MGLAREANDAAVQLFVVREGKLVGRDVFLLTDVAGETDATVVGAFIKQYYATRRIGAAARPDARPAGRGGGAGDDARRAPRRPRRAGRAAAGPQPPAARAGRPQRGRDAGREQARWLADAGKTLAALEELADALGLAAPPARIECYDISNIQGSNTVGSMVVFEDGRPRTGEYRRFRIRTVQGPDDFASHQEVLRRRFGHALRLEEGAVEEARWRLPDLVIIDGGKGQVSAAARGPGRARPARPAAGRPGQGARGAVPARPLRPGRAAAPARRPSTWSSACATRRTASPSPTTASCGPRRRSARCSTTCPASGRRASGPCCGSSARRAASARRPRRRWRRCPASARAWRRPSRRPWRPEHPAPDIVPADAPSLPLPHRGRRPGRARHRLRAQPVTPGHQRRREDRDPAGPRPPGWHLGRVPGRHHQRRRRRAPAT